MIEQFIDGFNSCGFLWETVKNSWRVFQKLFTKGEELLLTRAEFKALYDVNWSDIGSNGRDAEEDTMFSFQSILNTIAGTFLLTCLSINKKTVEKQSTCIFR
ncbi:hypothetical protein AMECASPLE_036482 [Ameca splendens]|uniref:Uncharacterized protein n=2 Tax=Goodeidae TaxID=28758 RepID=A0ABV0MGX2_9TELE